MVRAPHTLSVTAPQLFHCSTKATIVKLYLRTLKFELHIIFMCHEIWLNTILCPWDFSGIANDACSVAQSCLTFCDPMDFSPPGSSIYGIFQARILEWAAISSHRGSSQLRDWTCVSCIAGRFFTPEPSGKPTSLTNLSLNWKRLLVSWPLLLGGKRGYLPVEKVFLQDIKVGRRVEGRLGRLCYS